MATPPLLGKEDLIQYLTRRLGAPYHKIELTDCHYEDAIESALRWFTAKKGIKKSKFITINADQNEYALDEEVDTVIDVVFPTNPHDFSYLFTPYVFPEQQIPYNTFAAPMSQGVYSTFVQNIQYIETAKRILGAEPDWRQEDRKLYIFPIPRNTFDNSTTVGSMLITYKSNDVTLGKLNERDHDLIKRYALAFCKRDLGMIRDRFGIYPGAQGMVPSDGKRLLQEADIEFQKLDQEIDLSGFPMGYITG